MGNLPVRHTVMKQLVSVDTGEIPKEWSLANICPLYKKGDRSLACNYRPVSLTCVPCKLLEHIVCSNIMAHLDEHKLLSDRQHAFRKKHSCETQLITVIDDWAKILDKGGQVDTFILDFEKAFDTPPHELLKCKLYGYGIGGKTLKWIDSFLCDRQQRVMVLFYSLFYPITLGGRRGTTDEFATIPFHLDLFSAALVELAKSIPVHSLILSSHLFFCLPLFLFPFTVPCRIVFAKPEDLETWPNHRSFRFLTRVRSSSYSPMAAWIFLRTSSLVTWSLYEMFNSLR